MAYVKVSRFDPTVSYIVSNHSGLVLAFKGEEERAFFYGPLFIGMTPLERTFFYHRLNRPVSQVTGAGRLIVQYKED